jgi:hypothetical protein
MFLELMFSPWLEKGKENGFLKYHLILQNVQQHRKGVSFLFGEKKGNRKWSHSQTWYHPSSKTKRSQDTES